MRAVILAGGKGTRLRPYTAVLPKPLMPLEEIPILEVILKQLAFSGIRDITVTVGHLAALIESYFGDGERFGVNLIYFREDEPLGTIGSLPLIEDPGEDFLVMNGDILTDLDIPELIEDHIDHRATATIATHRRNVSIDFGVLEVGENTEITGFLEKPVYRYNVSMGIYIFNRRMLDYIPRGGPFGFDQLMLKLLNAGEQVRSHCHEGYWLDLGRPDDYETAVRDFAVMKSRFLREEQQKSAR